MPDPKTIADPAAIFLRKCGRSGRLYQWLAALAIALDAAAAIGFAYSFASAISLMTTGGEALPWLAGAIGALCVRALAQALRGQVSAAAGARMVKEARTAVLKAVATAGPAGLDGGTDGERSAQIVDRTALLAGHAAQWLPGRLATVLVPVLIVAAIFSQSWLAGVLILVSTLMLPIFIWLTASETASLARAQQDSLDSLAGTFEGRARMAGTLRAFNGVDREARTIERSADELASRTMKILRVAFLSTAVLEFFSAISIALVAVYVGFKLLGVFPFETFETVTLVEGLTALILAPEFFAPIRQMSVLHHARSDARAAAELLSGLVKPSTLPGTQHLPRRQNAFSIHWHSVDLKRGKDCVLKGFTGAAVPGEITLLWGRSGSGKTTALMSLLGLAESVAGEIRAGDIALNTRQSLAASAAWIGQKPWALEGSIRDNLRLGAPGASDDAMLLALERADCMRFLSGRRGALDYALRGGGAGLSGGELQRLAMARALLMDAPLWLLDEPTAHLDEKAQQQFLALVQRHKAGRTIVFASHSPAVREAADHVIQVGGEAP